MRPRSLALTAVAALAAACASAPFFAPPGSTVVLQANPGFVGAFGGTPGTSVITAFVTEPAGTPVSNGTIVRFFTNLGTIDPEGRTRDGVTRVNFVSDSRSGVATITAISGGSAPAPTASASPTTTAASGSGTASITVTVGNVNARLVLVGATPTRIQGSPRLSYIVATVVDERGNPVAGVPVYFTVEGTNTATERVESNPNPRFTDTSGRAEAILFTEYPADSPAKTVVVRASVPIPGSGTGSPSTGGGTLSGVVTVIIN